MACYAVELLLPLGVYIRIHVGKHSDAVADQQAGAKVSAAAAAAIPATPRATTRRTHGHQIQTQDGHESALWLHVVVAVVLCLAALQPKVAACQPT